MDVESSTGGGSLALIGPDLGYGGKEGRVNIVIREGVIENIEYGRDKRPVGIGDLDVIDCKDLRAIPALYDAHMHLFEWGIGRMGIDLSGARSSQDVLGALDDVHNGSVPNPMFGSNGLLWGIDYDDSSFTKPFFMTAKDLDRRYDGAPVLIKRVDGHVAFASSAFMNRYSGLSQTAPDGRLDDRTGLELLHSIEIDPQMAISAFQKAREMLWSLGVAGGVEITSMGRYTQLKKAFFESGGGLRLALSLVAELKGERREESLLKVGSWADESRRPIGRRILPIHFLKAFADGSIGARTAAFSIPFDDGSMMDPIMSKDDVSAFVKDCGSIGLIPMVHAIGDRALDSILAGTKDKNVPVRVEHLEHVRSDQIPLLASSRIIACMQPNFHLRWGAKGNLYASRFGLLYMDLNNFRMVSSTGIPLCFGTDLMPPGPISSFDGAIRHPNISARIPLEEVLAYYTTRSIRSSYLSSATGRLAYDNPGDVVLLDGIGDPKYVIIGGRVVHKGYSLKGNTKGKDSAENRKV